MYINIVSSNPGFSEYRINIKFLNKMLLYILHQNSVLVIVVPILATFPAHYNLIYLAILAYQSGPKEHELPRYITHLP
jgi:hypothetical protein